ncbi:MAG: NAD-dependent epimerase/dehydratase family protein [Candidatus Microthrix sp.]|nr:NAD-dependent epimerase/dehydratase family protein [Candidatus Microthrix sp.]
MSELPSLAGRSVFITGANGFVGRKLAERCRGLGAEVMGLDTVAEVERGVVAGDICDPAAWQGLLDGCDVLIHTAAVMTNNVNPAVAWGVNVVGTRRVIEAATIIRPADVYGPGCRPGCSSRWPPFDPADSCCRTTARGCSPPSTSTTWSTASWPQPPPGRPPGTSSIWAARSRSAPPNTSGTSTACWGWTAHPALLHPYCDRHRRGRQAQPPACGQTHRVGPGRHGDAQQVTARVQRQGPRAAGLGTAGEPGRRHGPHRGVAPSQRPPRRPGGMTATATPARRRSSTGVLSSMRVHIWSGSLRDRCIRIEAVAPDAFGSHPFADTP